jgi:hypothetical protein
VSARLFDRQCVVTLIKPVGLTGVSDTEQVKIRNLRVQFQVEKSLEKHPNKCEIKITNLSETSRAALQKKPVFVRLEAGYNDSIPELASGDLRYAQSKLDGADWESSLEIADGGRTYAHSRVSQSFRPGTLKQAVAEAYARSLELSLPKGFIIAGKYLSGLTAHGSTANELTKTLSSEGHTWSIQNGRLQILKENEVKQGAALVISADSGLIGSPEYGDPPKKGKPRTLKFETLLRPELIPGGLVFVDARAIQGHFKLTLVTHEGDTHGDKWSTTCEARSYTP